MKKQYSLFAFIIISFVMIFFSIYYVSLEHRVYSWDYTTYWKLWDKVAITLIQEPCSVLNMILKSVKVDDYNLIPIIFISLFKFLPIDNRISYIISIVICYFIPVVFLYHVVVSKITTVLDKIYSSIIYVLPATFVAFWTPTLRGYPDIVGLSFILLALLLVCKQDLSKISIKNAVILGLILWGAFLFRRWYAYTVFSLYLSLPFLNYAFFNSRLELKKIFIICINFAIAGCVSFLFAVLFQWSLLKKIILTDYSTIYSAYQSHFLTSLNITIDRVGLLLVAFALIGFLVSLFSNRKIKVFAIFALFNLVFTFIFFTRTQMPGMHHNLVFALWFLFLFTFAIDWIFRKFCITESGKAVFAIILTLGLIIIQTLSLLNVKFDKLLPMKSLPYTINNYVEYQRLLDTIQNLVKSNETISILSSSPSLNDDMLRTFSKGTLNKRVIRIAHVDLRDKINLLQYQSNYVVVTMPVQLHLNPIGQRIISIPVEVILNKRNIGNAYEKLDISFALDRGIKAFIYKKVRPFTKEEVSEFFDEFYRYYPNWRDLYDKPMITSYFSAKVDLSEKGIFRLSNDGSIFSRAGEYKETKVEWVLNTNYLKVTSVNTACNQTDPIIIKYGVPEYLKTIYLEKGTSIEIDMSNYMGKLSQFFIKKQKSINCGEVKIEGRD